MFQINSLEYHIDIWNKELMTFSFLNVLSYSSGLELIASKWSRTLTELDLAWANVQEPLDNAIKAIAEKGIDSPLK